MRLFVCIMFFFLATTEAYAEWHDDAARYRIELKPEMPNVVLFAEFYPIVYPATLKNGIAVYSESGRKLPYSLERESFELVTGGVVTGEHVYVYFGYDDAHPYNTWNELALGKIPEPRRLSLILSRRPTGSMPEESDMLAREHYQRYLEGRRVKSEDGSSEEPRIGTALFQTYNRLETNLDSYFRPYATPNELEDLSVESIFLDRDPTKESNFVTGQFTGRLIVSESGTYSFAINSRDSSYLVIDDKLVVKWPFKHEKSDLWGKQGDIWLDAGLHTLSFFFQKSERRTQPLYGTAAWRKMGANDFITLKESDFAQPYRSSVERCVDTRGNPTPLVRYQMGGYFFVDRVRKADLIQYYVEAVGSEFTPVWRVGQEILLSEDRVSGGRSDHPRGVSLALERNSDTQVLLSSKDGRFSDIPIRAPEELTNKSDEALVDLDIDMNIFVPQFLFDDEVLEMNLNVVPHIKLANKSLVSRVLLSISPNRKNSVASDEVSWIDVKADPFAQAHVFKRTMKLNGDALKREPLSVKFTLSVPPLVLSEKIVSFVPIMSCDNLTYGQVASDSSGNLQDSLGHIVVPILHRPTLSEKRAWSFAKSLINKVTRTKKVLVIADDYELDTHGGTFSKKLEDTLKTNGIALEFAS